MDVVNFPAILAQFGLLKSGDLVTKDDLLLIGKKVNNQRDGSQYQELAITLEELMKVPFCSISLQKRIEFGPTIFFDHPTGTGDTVFDTISPAVRITRNPLCGLGCLYNLAAGETCCDGNSIPGSSPVNTEWFWVQNPMTYDYAQAPSETYRPLLDIVYNDWPCGGMICAPGLQMIMHDTVTDEYWIIDFLTWQSGGGGAFTWNRRKLTVVCDGCIHFPDGSVQCTAAGAPAINATDLYVDQNFGDDSIALPNRFDRPYKTLNAALAAAIAPATVYVRPGTYEEFGVKLVSGVNMYFEPGAVLRNTILQDTGSDVTTGIFGYMDMTDGSYMNLTGGSNIKWEFNTVNTTNTFLVCNPGAGKTLNIDIHGKSVNTAGNFGFGATFRGATFGTLTIDDSFRSSAIFATIFFRSGSAQYSGNVTINCPKIYLSGAGTAKSVVIVNEGVTDNAIVNIYGDLINLNSNVGAYNAGLYCRRGKTTLYGNINYEADGGIGVIVDGGFFVGTGYVKVYGDIIMNKQTAVFASHRDVPLFVQGGFIKGADIGSYGKAVVIIGASLPGLPGMPNVWTYFKDCRIIQMEVGAEIVNLTGNGPTDYKILAYNTEFLYDKPGFPDTVVSAGGPRTPGFVNCTSNAALGAGITDHFVPSGFTTVPTLIIPEF